MTTPWFWTRCRRRELVHTAWLKAQHRSLMSLPPDERFNILFLGRDEFSCLVLKQLHSAKGMAYLFFFFFSVPALNPRMDVR